jgi:hypothetical protein
VQGWRPSRSAQAELTKLSRATTLGVVIRDTSKSSRERPACHIAWPDNVHPYPKPTLGFGRPLDHRAGSLEPALGVAVETLTESRDRFFHQTGLARCQNPWTAELQSIRVAGLRSKDAAAKLVLWNPCGPDAHSNCPELDERLRELKTLVDPRWRARVNAIYAGRVPYDGETASSLKEQKGSVVFVSFTYTYAMLGAFITLGDFAEFVDAARRQPSLSQVSNDLRHGVTTAFDALIAGDLEGSRIFETTETVMTAVGRTSQWAELFVIGHEVGHLIMRDQGSRPDREAQARVEDLLRTPSLAVEISDLNAIQMGEVRADIMSLLLVAGEYVQEVHLHHELAAIEGAMMALLAVGLVDGEWTASPSHPSPLTRMAVVAKIGSHRILKRDEEPLSLREDFVRAIAMRLAYAAWLADTTIQPVTVPEGTDVASTASANMVAAATALFVPQDWPMFF